MKAVQVKVHRRATTTRELFERELRAGGDGLEPGSIEEETVDLSELALQTVEVCFAAAAPGGGDPDGAFFWTRPSIRSGTASEEELPGAADAARKATRTAPGEASRRSCITLPDISIVAQEVPVTFPPGRARLATSPTPTGSPGWPNATSAQRPGTCWTS